MMQKFGFDRAWLLHIDLANEVLARDVAHGRVVFRDFPGLVLVGVAPGLHEPIVLGLAWLQVVAAGVFDHQEQVGITACRNLALENEEILDLAQFLGRANAKTLRDDDKLHDGLKRTVRQSANDEIGKKPEVTIVVSRLS